MGGEFTYQPKIPSPTKIGSKMGGEFTYQPKIPSPTKIGFKMGGEFTYQPKIPSPTKIGSKMGGEFTYQPKIPSPTKIGSKIGGEFTYQPKWDPKTVLTTTAKGAVDIKPIRTCSGFPPWRPDRAAARPQERRRPPFGFHPSAIFGSTLGFTSLRNLGFRLVLCLPLVSLFQTH